MIICGLIIQQFSKNNIVYPTTVVTLDSARLGILVSMMLFTSASTILKITVSFAFAIIGTFIFMQILDKIKFKDAIFIPLVGLMFGSIINSVSTFFAYRND